MLSSSSVQKQYVVQGFRPTALVVGGSPQRAAMSTQQGNGPEAQVLSSEVPVQLRETLRQLVTKYSPQQPLTTR